MEWHGQCLVQGSHSAGKRQFFHWPMGKQAIADAMLLRNGVGLDLDDSWDRIVGSLSALCGRPSAGRETGGSSAIYPVKRGFCRRPATRGGSRPGLWDSQVIVSASWCY